MSTRPRNIAVLCLFTAANAALFGLGVECLFHLIGIMLGAAIDSGVAFDYPRFVPFCLCAGLVALIGLIVLLVINVNVSKKCGYTKTTWWLQTAAAFVLSIPMMKLWELLFDFLRTTF